MSSSFFPSGTFVDALEKNSIYKFHSGMTWQYLFSGEVDAQGTYRVVGNRWTENGTDECPFLGTYEWEFDGSRMTFKLVGEDPCSPGRESTDGHTHILQN